MKGTWKLSVAISMLEQAGLQQWVAVLAMQRTVTHPVPAHCLVLWLHQHCLAVHVMVLCTAAWLAVAVPNTTVGF